MCHPSHTDVCRVIRRPTPRLRASHQISGGKLMISVTKLLGGPSFYGDRLRYDQTSSKVSHGTTSGSGPVVVWNATKTCNLECVHCYADAEKTKFKGELTTDEAKAMIDDLTAFKV